MTTLALVGASTSSASVLKQTTAGGTDLLGVGTSIEITQEALSSSFLEDSFGFTATTCTGSSLSGKLDRVTPIGNRKSYLSTVTFSGCGHTVDVSSGGELEITSIAGTTNGKLYSWDLTGRIFNTLLNQNCLFDTFGGGNIGTITAATSYTGRATVDINGLIHLEGCSATFARWTGQYEVTKPSGLIIEAS